MELERNDREPAAGDGPASRQHDAYSGPGAAGAEEVARATDQQAASTGEVASLVDETARGA
ncbi:uncharacterized protein HVO_A0607A (plasmid) [Haloferax volcanii DS2]|uniref:Uncharacterized protein n=2 Tax=Haloferax volcanii (strain ATCC 29605 / DSM 3757 / JCM 8879 / NBRC 14742 / NCIMB 2012 / VKM B-1768 / DS2) TaxID=309800 RepID=A0A8E8PJC4_HALVD|nr:hypothetical protein C498_00845 [Haloferax volcanii DS2]QWE89790.1 uncharacterized protein HVO_A0607A [Haloferax volcanii DS2]